MQHKTVDTVDGGSAFISFATPPYWSEGTRIPAETILNQATRNRPSQRAHYDTCQPVTEVGQVRATNLTDWLPNEQGIAHCCIARASMRP